MTRFRTLLAAAGFWLVASWLPSAMPTATAQRKPSPACGFSFLPIVAGNTWAYENEHRRVNILIKRVGPSATRKGVTEIKVAEMLGTRQIETTWTCTQAGGITMSPRSFFFAGEPGGVVGGSLQVSKHKNATLLPAPRLRGGVEWVERIEAELTRVDSSESKLGLEHAPGRVSLSRIATDLGSVDVTVNGELIRRAKKIGFQLTGQAFVEDIRVDFPLVRPQINVRQGAIWMQDNIGVVRIDDVYDRTWLLGSTNVRR